MLASLRVVARFMHACTAGGWSSANWVIPAPEMAWKKRKPPTKKTST